VIDASAEERVERAQIEYDEKQGSEELKVDVQEIKEAQQEEEQPKKRVEKPNEDAGETLVIENEEDTQPDLDPQNDDESEPEPQNNDTPSWFNS
jgi:hypothetical protein